MESNDMELCDEIIGVIVVQFWQGVLEYSQYIFPNFWYPCLFWLFRVTYLILKIVSR